MDLAAIIREVLDLWQNPPYSELPLEALLAACNRSVKQALLDLDLTPQASFLAARSNTFSFSSPDDREKDLSFLDDLSRPLRVESRSIDSVSEDDWSEFEITSFDNWNDAMERSDVDLCAFRGTPPALTMIVARDVSNEQFRIAYSSQLAEITATTDTVQLPELFKPYLVYDIALEAGELIDNLSPEFAARKAAKMPYLVSRRGDAKERLDKWRRSQKGSSVTTRRAFNDRLPGGTTAPTRRRFTITF